jgi:hypothetical protein
MELILKRARRGETSYEIQEKAAIIRERGSSRGFAYSVHV